MPTFRQMLMMSFMPWKFFGERPLKSQEHLAWIGRNALELQQREKEKVPPLADGEMTVMGRTWELKG
jgi:hypothetical protein